MSGSLRTSAVAAILILAGGPAGCDDPCEELERKVCEELDEESRCRVMQDADRREHLSREACAGILDRLDRR